MEDNQQSGRKTQRYPSDSHRLHIRSQEIKEWVELYAGAPTSVGRVFLEWFKDLIEFEISHMPMTVQELAVVIESSQGFSFKLLDRQMPTLLWASITDSIKKINLDTKTLGVDEEVLEKKLRQLSRSQCYALSCAILQYWEGYTDGEPLLDGLCRVGLSKNV